jgi:hypothetical protein
VTAFAHPSHRNRDLPQHTGMGGTLYVFGLP